MVLVPLGNQKCACNALYSSAKYKILHPAAQRCARARGLVLQLKLALSRRASMKSD
jgi:hypothetical protein